jgi:hypothetical protein
LLRTRPRIGLSLGVEPAAWQAQGARIPVAPSNPRRCAPAPDRTTHRRSHLKGRRHGSRKRRSETVHDLRMQRHDAIRQTTPARSARQRAGRGTVDCGSRHCRVELQQRACTLPRDSRYLSRMMKRWLAVVWNNVAS